MVEPASFNKWLIFTDGSPSSQEAIELVLKVLMKPSDRITVSHIYDSARQYLPTQFKQENIKQNVEAQLLPYLQQGQWSLHWQSKTGSKTTQDLILQIAEFCQSNFMVLGYLGRKGAKIDSNCGGSAVVNSLQKSPCNTIIVKKTSARTQQEGLSWVCCVDRSELAQKGFELAVKLHQPGVDKIKVVYLFHKAKGTGVDQQVKEKYQKLIKSMNAAASFEILQQGNKTKADALCDYIRESGTDIVTMGRVGKNKEGLYKKQIGETIFNLVGSLTEAVTSKAKCNVLMAANY